MKLATAFNYRKPNNRQTKQGQSGYDNARENIDPHIRTKTVSQLQGTIEHTPTNAKDIANKEYVDANGGGAYHPHQDVQTTAQPTFERIELATASGPQVLFTFEANEFKILDIGDIYFRNDYQDKDIIFLFNYAGSTGREIMRLDASTDRVGIGCYPSYKLDVNGTFRCSQQAILADTSAMATNAAPINAVDIVNKKYVDDQFPVTHTSTTGQTANDHHAKLHRHNATDGSGQRLNNTFVNLGGESTADIGMLGIYDKNQLANATEKGSCTITIIGAGTAVPAAYYKMFNSEGDHAQVVTGINATTSKIEIVIDTGSLQGCYGSAKWHPFFQSRLGFDATGTHPRMVAVEVSNDGITWYMPSSGQWTTADIGADSQVPGYWFGTSGIPRSPSNLPGWSWRYAKFTLEDFYINNTYAHKDKLWISQLGVRHYAHAFCPQYPKVAFKNYFLDENYFADKVGIGTQSPTELLDISSDAIRLRTAQTPASAGATGTAGTICWDTNYIYVCTATNTWKRTALSTW